MIRINLLRNRKTRKRIVNELGLSAREMGKFFCDLGNAASKTGLIMWCLKYELQDCKETNLLKRLWLKLWN